MRRFATILSCFSVVVVVSVVVAVPAGAQSVPRVVPGWGVDIRVAAWSDEAWHAAVPGLFHAWRKYLMSSPERQAPTELRSSAEQAQWEVFDQTAGSAYKGFPATMVGIRALGRERAGRSAAFADSLADAFRLPRLKTVLGTT